jgi:hypothetical protein
MPLNFLNTGYFAAKVGIGVNSPFSTLQVGSNTFSGGNGMAADSRVGISNHGILTGMMLASTYNDPTYPEYGLVFVQGPSTSSYNVWSISPDGPAKGSGLSFIYKADATNIHNQTPQVYFEGSTGNVGIGTTSPSEKLEVQDGNIKIETTTNTDAKLILNSYSNALGSTYQWEVISASSANNYNFQIREAGQAYVTVDSSVTGNAGYVGIGTTTPSTKLQVNGRIKADEGVQVGNETSTTASLALVGTLRYRGAIASGLSTVSVVEMCMQTGSSTFAWKVIYTTPAF